MHGDSVYARRKRGGSHHEGDYWVGTFEVGGDGPQGSLTSAPFKVTHPFASFLVGGGSRPETRVELVAADDQKVIFKTSAFNAEEMRRVVVDLSGVQGRTIFIRLVDDDSGGWGHINFDDFLFYEEEPVFPNQFGRTNIAGSEGGRGSRPTPAAELLTGAIHDHYEKLGGINCSFLLSPLGSEKACTDGLGHCCDFKGGASIYWTTSYGAWSIRGPIRDNWRSLNAEAGVLGYPVTDEMVAADGVGRFNHFKNPRLNDQEGSIYFTPSTGAHELHGPIRDKWVSLGSERSELGYPTSDQYTLEDGTGRVRSIFQNGTITYDPATGHVTVREVGIRTTPGCSV